MKFSCEKETLLNLLNIASRAVTGKSSKVCCWQPMQIP